MEREFKTIKTPISNNEVVMKSWLTGKEKRLIQSVFTDDISFKGGTDYVLSGKKLSEAQDKTISIVVESIDGSKEKILEKILDMRSEDFDFIIAEINKASSPVIEEIKK